jgi:NitT/TauT family transport system ATP-binding protein
LAARRRFDANPFNLLRPPRLAERVTNSSEFIGNAPRVENSAVRAHGLSHVFPGGIAALEDINLECDRGEFVAVMGPSGCGKSTLLRLFAGLIEPTSGEILLDGSRPLEARQMNASIGFVFQAPALLPWRTVERNARLAFELDARIDRRLRKRVAELLDSVGLADFRETFPGRLSGGMRMRAALVRALAPDPSLLLLDEPFAALDEITRQELQDLLLTLRPHGTRASLLVTHNAFEAVYMASRILVLSPRPGRILAEFSVPFGLPGAARREPALRARPEYAALVGAVTTALQSCRP